MVKAGAARKVNQKKKEAKKTSDEIDTWMNTKPLTAIPQDDIDKFLEGSTERRKEIIQEWTSKLIKASDVVTEVDQPQVSQVSVQAFHARALC